MNLNVKAYTKQLKGFQKEAIKQTREVAGVSADAVLGGKKIVRKAEKATLTLNNIAYGTVEKLIGKRFDMVEKTLDASAKRLKASAKAKSVKAFLKAHSDLNEKTIARLTKDFNDTITIVVDAKDNVVELFNDVYTVKPVKAKKVVAKAKKTVKAKAKTAKKPVKKTAKKVAKKATRKPAKKVTKKVAKKTAKKTTRRRTAKVSYKVLSSQILTKTCIGL